MARPYEKLRKRRQESSEELRDLIKGCFRQTVSVACTRLAKEPWVEVLKAQAVGAGVLTTMAEVDNDPIKWKRAVGGHQSEARFHAALKLASFGLAGLAYLPDGVDVPMVGLKFNVEAEHPDKPPEPAA